MTFRAFFGHRYVKLFVKVVVSVLCLYVVFRKINFNEMSHLFWKAHPIYLVAAGLFFILSKLFSSVRLHKYLACSGVAVSQLENVKLYWLGMFYNLFLPGGIGGDGYKAYYLHKRYKDVGLKKIIILLLKDRLNGLAVVCMMLLSMAGCMTLSFPISNWWIFAGLIAGSLGLYLIEKLMKPDSAAFLWYTAVFSFLVQVTQIISMLFLLVALGVSEHYVEISFVFLLSTIIAMMPFTIGGIGFRELTFLYFAEYFHYDKSILVAVAFLFFIITSLLSLPGVYYHFRNDKLQ
ncbi:MAG TPA: lysylphosphatidylglycerol synthase transmembrane domain-containing protein [Cytophagaceae bacterium]|nr:lysylphosphatidylglycerol synthase transmembrane domain-containing protein [Cytophagaceae bacterium]